MLADFEPIGNEPKCGQKVCINKNNFNDNPGNQTRGLPCFISVPKPTATPRAPHIFGIVMKKCVAYNPFYAYLVSRNKLHKTCSHNSPSRKKSLNIEWFDIFNYFDDKWNNRQSDSHPILYI